MVESRLPEIKEILGALIFAANRPLSVADMHRCIVQVAEVGEREAAFAEATEDDVTTALDMLAREIVDSRCGFVLDEVAGGFRLQSDINCGPWVRHLLEVKSNRLSKPALETLAVVAHRQPVSRSNIEAVRGVAVDHVLRVLLEMQLVRIVGRSELPGRPFLYGTTQLFLDHFGLKSLDDLDGVFPMRKAAVAESASEPEAGEGTEKAADSDEEADEADEPTTVVEDADAAEPQAG